MVVDEILTDRGYREYPKTVFDNDHVVARFQKRFDDEIGKKYFVNVVKLDCSYVPLDKRGNHWTPYIYEYECYLSMFDEDKPVKMEFYAGWLVEEVEEYAEKVWQQMGHNYYERWDEC